MKLIKLDQRLEELRNMSDKVKADPKLSPGELDEAQDYIKGEQFVLSLIRKYG